MTDLPAAASARRTFRSTAAIAVAATTVTALPLLLLGGLAVLVQRELAFGPAQLGVAVAGAFAVGALASPLTGRLTERQGPRWSMRVGLAAAGCSLLGMGLIANSWAVLLIFAAVAGLGITATQLGTNILIARRVPAERQGLAFGMKQAAVPFASLLSGLALPVVGMTLGWRAALLLAAVLVVLVAARLPDSPPVPRTRPGDGGDAHLASLIVLALGVAFGSAAGNSIPAFLVASAVDRGVALPTGGMILAIGSLVGIAVRVAGGWGGDRLGGSALRLVSALLLVGAVGTTGLALAHDPALIALFASLAFGGGWGWAGLVILAVARANPAAAGRAMGIVQVGPMGGAVVGPLAFGFVADALGFAAAWFMLALLGIAGAAIVTYSGRLLARR